MKDVHQELLGLVARLELLERAYTSAGHIGPADASSRESSPRVRIGRLIMLCGALLRNVVLPVVTGEKRTQRHVAVFGGTQVGKSTMVNVLAGDTVARVHHTAGYTRHAQAFLPAGANEDLLQGFPQSFPGFTRVTQDELKLSDPNAYAVRQLDKPPTVNAILWDVPDCDAVDSSVYQRGMIEAATIADAVVYVTSREKYAVNVVLEWLLLLLQAGIPVVGALNMAPAAQQQDIVDSMTQALQRVADRQGATDIDTPSLGSRTVAFEYVQDADVSIFYGSEYTAANQLRRHVTSLLNTPGTSRGRAIHALDFVRTTLPEILAPALSEADAAGTWDKLVQLSLSEFMNEYRRGYLDDPHQYDAFNLVGIEILALLNPPIPGLKKAIGAVRTVLGLPAKLLIFAGRAAWRGATSGVENEGRPSRTKFARSGRHIHLCSTCSRASGRRNRRSPGITVSGMHCPNGGATNWP